MTTYKNKEEFEAILSRLWDRILETPEIVASVSWVKLIARVRYTDYPSALYIDISGDTPAYYFNPEKEMTPDVDMILSSETSHLFWLETLNVPMAIATRKIIPKGSVQKALKLIHKKLNLCVNVFSISACLNCDTISHFQTTIFI